MAALAVFYGMNAGNYSSREDIMRSLSIRADSEFRYFKTTNDQPAWVECNALSKGHDMNGPVIAFAESFQDEAEHYLVRDHLVICLDGKIYDGDHKKIPLTEVAHRFKRDGMCSLQSLYGRWAMIIGDAETQSVYIVRDPAGIQPMYFSEMQGSFIAVSQSHALRENKISPELKPSAVFRLLALSGSEQRASALTEGIEELKPGYGLNYSWKTRTLQLERLFPLKQRVKKASEVGFLINDLRKEIRCNTLQSLRNDQSIAIGLSSGLDSNILASIVRDFPRIEAYSSSFSGFERDEFEASAIAAKHHGFELIPVSCSSDDLIREFEGYVKALDLPVVTGGTFLKYELFRRAKASGTVWLDGEGGDSLFGGLMNQRRSYTIQAFHSGQISLAFKLLSSQKNALGSLAKDLLARFPTVFQFAVAKSLLQEWTYLREDFLYSCLGEQVFEPFETELQASIVAKYFDDGMNYSLRCHDRISHYFKFPCAMPLAEYSPLTELALSVPDQWRIRNGFGKYILRIAFRDELPETVFNQGEKYGMEVPIDHWLRDARDYFMDILGSSLSDEFVDVAKLRRDYDRFNQTDVHFPAQMYTLLHFLAWRKINKI